MLCVHCPFLPPLTGILPTTSTASRCDGTMDRCIVRPLVPNLPRSEGVRPCLTRITSCRLVDHPCYRFLVWTHFFLAKPYHEITPPSTGFFKDRDTISFCSGKTT